MPNELGDHLNLTVRSRRTFLTMLYSPSKSLHKLVQEEDIGLQQRIKWSEKNWNSSHTKRSKNWNWWIMKNESITVKGLQILFKRKLLIFLISPSLQMRPGSTSWVMLTHNCVRRRVLMLCMKNPSMTRNLECGLWYPGGTLLALYSLKKLWTVNIIVQCSMISPANLRKMKSDTPGFNKIALLHTHLTTPWNFWEIFGERVISRNLRPLSLAGSYSTTVESSKIFSVSWLPTHT